MLKVNCTWRMGVNLARVLLINIAPFTTVDLLMLKSLTQFSCLIRPVSRDPKYMVWHAACFQSCTHISIQYTSH